MKIIVLAGGEGKRMWPITTDKCLIPFLGKPLLYHNLKKIKLHLEGVKGLPDSASSWQAGHLPGELTSFVIIANPKSKERVEKVAQELGLTYKIAIQNEPKGMADALLSAKDFITGEILVVNAEDVLDKQVYQGVLETQGDVVVAGFKVDKYFPGGYIENVKGQSSKVKSIVEKPGEGKEPSDMVKLVVDYFKDGEKLIEYLTKASSDKDDLYEIALDQMIQDGVDVKFSKYEGIWLPLKYPWHILDITSYFLSTIDEKVYPGKVMMEEGVKVFEGAVIRGPVYLGKNCIVGNNSIVRESNLEEGVVTGYSSDITRSYIGANSWFHTNYIGDSVVEGDLGMGSGAVLANLRLDDQTIKTGAEKVETGRKKLGLMAGKGVRIGVNAAIMPGVKVGSNSLVGPGVVLKEDLEENKKITVKKESYEVCDYQSSHTSYDQFRDQLK